MCFQQHTGFVRITFCFFPAPIFLSAGTVAFYLAVRGLPTTRCPQNDYSYRLAYTPGFVKREMQKVSGLSRIPSPWLARDRARKRGCDQMSFPGSAVTGELQPAGATERRFFRPRSHLRFAATRQSEKRGSFRVADHPPGIAVSADFRWPRSRRRRTTPPHSRSSNRLKQETARPSQFPQDDPSIPVGSGIRTSASSPCRVAGSPVCRPDPGSARSPGYSCPSVR